MRYLKSKKNGVMVIVLILMTCFFSRGSIQAEELLTIKDLKVPDWEKFVNKTVVIEGIFVRDPLPMLVTDLNIVLANTPMPEDRYVVLSGKEAENIDPKKYGGARLKLSGLVKVVEDKIKYKGENLVILPTKYELVERVQKYHPFIVGVKIRPFYLKNRYAILFSGGYNAANNHVRYWNDLKFMYSTLINKYGYTDKTIYVLYADGTGRDSDMTVDYAATETNLKKLLDKLRYNATTRDFIFIFTTNHGGGFLAEDLTSPNAHGGQFDADGDEGEEPLYESVYDMDLSGDGDKNDQVAWDEVLYGWGSDILDDTFHDVFKKLKYNKMVIVMEQCYSGGLIFDLAQSGTNKAIMSAAGQYESSWGMPPSYNYDEFSYHFTCAINQADPDGNVVKADSNRDGKVSMVEAFNYARKMDTQEETPWYEDSGDGVPHSGEMPASGEGTLGSSTFLK